MTANPTAFPYEPDDDELEPALEPLELVARALFEIADAIRDHTHALTCPGCAGEREPSHRGH